MTEPQLGGMERLLGQAKRDLATLIQELRPVALDGKGLVPEALTTQPEFLLALALGAGATVILATLLGFPISTTHGLTGALAGVFAMALTAVRICSVVVAGSTKSTPANPLTCRSTKAGRTTRRGP
jgi:hypothetical protein